MVCHRLGCLGHRLQKIVLRGQVAPHLGGILGLPGRMYPRLARRRGDADRDVLHRTAEAAHGVPLEVREHHREIIGGVVRPHEVLPEVPAALHGQAYLAFGIHDVHRGDGREAVFRAGASAAVGGIAFDDRAAHLLHQILDKLRLEKVVPAGFPRREFHGHLARRRTLQRLVQAHHILRRDVPHEIDPGCLGRFSAALCRSAGRGRERQDRQ